MTTLSAVRRALRDYRARMDEAPAAHQAAVALIVLEGPTGLESLFIRRAERAEDPWSGHVALPGGRRDPADADLRATAIRETREETGVDLSAGELLGVLDDLYPRTPTLPPVSVRPFVFALPARVTPVPSHEVQRAFWLPLARFAEPGVRGDVVLTVRGAQHVVPAYAIGDDVIWGLTERILTPFLMLVGVLL